MILTSCIGEQSLSSSKSLSPSTGKPEEPPATPTIRERRHQKDAETESLKTHQNVAQQQDKSPLLLPDEKRKSFIWTTSPQVHSVRRRCILEKHPEVEKLFGYDRGYVSERRPAILRDNRKRKSFILN